MIVKFDKTGSVGIITDVAPNSIPPEAWSYGQNVVCNDQAIERIGGHAENYGTPTVTPYGLFQVTTAGTVYWAYTGLDDAYCVTGTTHTKITRAAGVYTGTTADRWNGTVLGGLLVVNNGVDDPQLWSPATAATALVDLTNWPASTVTKVIRSYKNFLIALNVTESGTNKPHRIMWSQPAEPGTVPTSWDYTSDTVDAGITDIQGSGILVDSLAMGEQNIIYKEGSTTSMQFIGAPLIFRFSPVFTESGMLAQGCAAEINGSHCVLTQGDLIMHNAVAAESVIDGRMRSWLFKNIDTANYTKCRVIKSRQRKEVYVMFPSGGSNELDMCLIWDYSNNTTTIKELPQVLCAGTGIAEGPATFTYDTINETYDATTLDYTNSVYTKTMPRVMMGKATDLLLDDSGSDFNGTSITAYCEKTAMDFGVPEQYKLVKSVRPRFEAVAGVQVNIYVGTQDTLESSVSWGTPQTFTVGTDYKVDFLKTSRYIGIKFETIGGKKWRLNSFDMDIEPQGFF